MKVAIVTLMPGFLENIKDTLKKAGHEYRVFMPTGDNSKDFWKLSEDCNWADLIFCEFCQHPMEIITNTLEDKPIIARMHRIEAYNPEFIKKVNWENVDLLMITSDHIKDKFDQALTGRIKPLEVLVYNTAYVNLDKFKFKERDYTDKVKIVISGNVIPRKRAFDSLQLLCDLPNNFGLSIVGNLKDSEYFSHMQDFAHAAKLEDRVSILKEVSYDMMPEVFADHDIVLGLSTDEGVHYSIAEAMATGCFPVCSYWKDCEKVYPDYSHHKGFLDIFTSLRNWAKLSSEAKATESRDARMWAERNFSIEKESDLFLEAIGRFNPK